MRAGDEHKLGFVTPYGMYCYTVMGQGLTGGTHTYSRFRDLAFGNIPEGIGDDGEIIQGFPSIIGDRGNVAFDGMIDDSYGSTGTFDDMFNLLLYEFFPKCAWAPMYLKGPKCHFFERSLSLLGLEAGEDGIRPSLRKRTMITQWPTPTSWEEVRAFCYLTPFLRRFIPGRAEWVRIMKKGMEVEVYEEEEMEGDDGGGPERKKPEEKETDIGKAKKKRKVSKPRKVEGPFIWTAEHECAFQAIKQAIATNAMASPNPDLQYHLAVDASKRGIGGVLFQLENIKAYTEATNSEIHKAAERLIMFLSFRLEDPETRYSNSEREALAVVRCLAEVKWMVMASLYPTLVYTDHEALKVLLTGPDNDAHGRIVKWQERLGEYDFQLLHHTAGTHFMGIADGLSRLPTTLMQQAFIEDSEGPRPCPMGSSIVSSGQPGIDIKTPTTARLAVSLRAGLGLGFQKMLRNINTIKVKKHGGKVERRKGDGRESGVANVLGGEIEEWGSMQEGEMLGKGAMEMRREKWRKWLNSRFYREVMRAKLDGLRA